MVKVLIDIPEETDIRLRHFMIDEKIVDKRIAIVKILKEHFDDN